MGVRKNFGLDSPVTISAIGIGAYILAVILHQIVGHTLFCLITGGNVTLLTSVYFQCDSNNILSNAAAPAVNFAAGILLFIISKAKSNLTIHAHFFLLIASAFNLFWGSGSLIYSGITNSGDWSYAINSLEPVWIWKLVLLVSGIISYLIAAKIVIVKVRELTLGNQERIPKLLLIPYLSAGISACIAAWLYVQDTLIAFKDASPQIFIYSIGFLFILQKARKKTVGFSNYTPVTRHLVLIFFVAIVYSLFLLIFGRGISF